MSPDNEIEGSGFTILPDGHKHARDLAFTTFPELRDKFDGPQDEFLDDTYYVYDLLASEMLSQWTDETFRKRSGGFLDALANSGDSLLENLLVVCLLESLAANEGISSRVKIDLGEKAREVLSRVEREMFGRK